MIYQITFNGSKGFRQFKINVKSIHELLDEILRLSHEFGEPFDMIYLIDGRN